MPKELTSYYDRKPTWDVLMPPRLLGGTGIYTFHPGLNIPNYNERDLFAHMLERVRNQANVNKHLTFVKF